MTSSAVQARRWFLIVAPALAGALIVLGAATDPAPAETGKAMLTAYAADPDMLQWKSFGFHFGYTLWLATVLVLATEIRGRGGWLANVAWILALLGISTIPGFIIADFYDSALTNATSATMSLEIQDAMEGMWGLIVLGATGSIGFILALPVGTIAAVRAGLIPAWGAGAAIGGFIAMHLLGTDVPGAACFAVGMSALSVALYGGLAPKQELQAAPA
ncbi:MAG: hypothetical protein JHC98_04690 [Thermoleophilaceae bacterium]|nr:hypothetical protein [Thermoleophilaceae bacterium]